MFRSHIFWRHTSILILVILLFSVNILGAIHARGTVGNTTLSPFIWGSNLSTYNNQDFFLTNTQTQQNAQRMHIQMMRFPDRGDRSVYLAAAQEIKTLGEVPLAILPFGDSGADQQLVQDMNTVFGASLVYYEYGNEQDLAGVDANAYVTSWNAIVPQLKALAHNANFIGPVNFQANPQYIATFVQHASPKPDEVSWHEYTCPTSASNDTCINTISYWTQHIADTRSAIRAALGSDIPVMITEYNWNPNAENDPRRNDDAFLSTWTTRAFQTLVQNQVFAANQYVLSNNQSLAMIRDSDHTLTGQGQAFQAAYEHSMGSLGTPATGTVGTSTPTATTQTPPVTPSPTITPTATTQPPSVTPTATTTQPPSVTPTAQPCQRSTPSTQDVLCPPAPCQVAPSGNTPTASTLHLATHAWLHVDKAGIVVDTRGCIVPLVGLNMGNLSYGDAGGATSLKDVLFYQQTFHTNLVRVKFNASWWNANVFVPKAHMPFRQWLQQYVQWQEQAGNYVQLVGGPHFIQPPCGGDVTFCPSENQAQEDTPNSISQESTIAPLLQVWSDLAALYANDPSVLYDAWNEPSTDVVKDEPTFFHETNQLITTIRAKNPRSLVVVYARGLRDVMEGKIHNYSQPNLVFDAHIYDGFHGLSPATGKVCNEPGQENTFPLSDLIQKADFAHTHGQGFLINEWGGCYDVPTYHVQLTVFAQCMHVGLAYYRVEDIVDTKPSGAIKPNANGLLVATTYATILHSASN